VLDEELPAGEHQLLWDGTNEYGVPVATGTYRWRIFVGDQLFVRQVTLVR
jgi:flagellar hook assembly protein FlgD